MIYQVRLPELTRKRLTDIVQLQIQLLRYAASTAVLRQEECARYLDGCANFSGKGERISQWLWNQGRRVLLEEFAKDNSFDKDTWCARLEGEARNLFSNPTGLIEKYDSSTVTDGQKAAAEFFIDFYNTYIGGKTRLPAFLFSEAGADPFGRVAFLKAFTDANDGLTVCAACDLFDYNTKAGKYIYADIDHYLPKEFYPHLACHPYNLIPVCKYCNSPIKGVFDPLQERTIRLRLEDIFLPYREQGLSARTYLEIIFSGNPRIAEIGVLRPLSTFSPSYRIETFDRVYKIPTRWRAKADSIGKQLFKDIFDTLQIEFVPATLTPELLDLLDYTLHKLQRALGERPYTFPKMWWLAALINQTIHASTGGQPENALLLLEIQGWIRDNQLSTSPGPYRSIAKLVPNELVEARRIRQISEGRV